MEIFISVLVGFVVAMGFMQAVVIVILLKNVVSGQEHKREPQSLAQTRISRNNIV
jgi:hypothetical protein